MLNKNKDEGVLPRIQSQKRVNTALDRKDSSRDTLSNQTQPNNRQLKRTLSAVNNCKAVKYEATGLMYTKKLQQLQKRNSLLDKQIKKVQQDIKEQRKNCTASAKIQNKQKMQTFLTEASKVTDSKVSYRKNININDEKSLNNEIRISENKIQILRKKIDEQLQKNQKVRRQVDVVRKEVNTLKTVNKNIQISLQKTTEQFNQFSELSRTLEQQIANKNILMHRTKIQGQHKKAQIIKQYDKILKQLDKELNDDKNSHKNASETASQALYLTQFGEHNLNPIAIEPSKNSKFHLMISRKSKTNMNSQISLVKAKLQKYQKQFEQLKKQTGARNTEQAVKQFQDKYQKNFNYYKYINELHASLQQKQREYEELTSKKNGILQQIQARTSNAKYEEVVQIKNQLNMVRSQKAKYSNISEDYQNIFTKLKQVVIQFYSKVEIKDDLDTNNISQQNLVHYLASIKQRCNELDNKFEYQIDKLQIHQFSTQNDLAEMLQNAKKQNNHESVDQRNEKILSRQQFIKARETFMKKRQTPRKTLYKK